MTRRSRRVLWYLAAVACVVAAFAAYLEFTLLEQRNGLKQIPSFAGLRRDEAYARLRAFGLTATTWPDSTDQYLVSTDPSVAVSAWPETGDVEVNFNRVNVDGPPGTCGANARIVLRFSDDHVVKIGQGKTLYACL